MKALHLLIQVLTLYSQHFRSLGAIAIALAKRLLDAPSLKLVNQLAVA